MSTNIANKSPFLITSRQFSTDINQLSVQLGKSYIDTANTINVRTIGIFSTGNQIITGEGWYLEGGNKKQQSLRQVFTFTSTSSINHNVSNIPTGDFIRCFGSYTDGTNSYGLIYGTSVAVAGQILFYVTSTQIVFVVGAGAPALSSGKIVLEWLSAS